MDPETHKEIVEIKRQITEIRQAQDAGFHHDESKYRDMLDKAIDNDPLAANVLLKVDGFRSAKEIEKELNLYQVKCWRILDRLLSKDVIYPLEATKKGSAVYKQSRWFVKLRFEEYVGKKYLKEEVQSIAEKREPNKEQAV